MDRSCPLSPVTPIPLSFWSSRPVNPPSDVTISHHHGRAGAVNSPERPAVGSKNPIHRTQSSVANCIHHTEQEVFRGEF